MRAGRALIRSLLVLALAAAGLSCGADRLPDGNLRRLEGPMTQLPQEEEGGYLIRTDFSDPGAWQSTLQAVRARYDIFEGSFRVIDDPSYAGATPQAIVARLGPRFDQTYIMVVDRTTLSHPERPVLFVNLWERAMDEFRAVPAQVGGIQINLSLANMDFEDYAGAADPDGIFRGF
jgi:hypothetical protein